MPIATSSLHSNRPPLPSHLASLLLSLPLSLGLGMLLLPLQAVETPETSPPAREKVLLGSEGLTAGIPGKGPLQYDEIVTWLADPRNHTELDPQLPRNLANGILPQDCLKKNPLTRAKIELGRQLFFDPRLSSDGTISCASCHQPEHGYAAPTQFGVGVGGQQGARNSPVAYNRLFSDLQFWHGSAKSLEEQAAGPIANPIEMGNTHEACVAQLDDIECYRQQFEAIFDDGLTMENVSKAIASFERVLVTGPSPWDDYERLADFEAMFREDLEDLEWLAEEDPQLLAEYRKLQQASAAHPVSEAAIRGAEVFLDPQVNCTACHNGPNFTDELYHNLGVGMDAENPDLGRFEVTGQEKERGAFKTPTLRNVAQTAPYMHDGSQQTLREVIDWYAQGGHPNPWLDELVVPIELSEQEREDLVAFLQALTGPLPKVEPGRLPK